MKSTGKINSEKFAVKLYDKNKQNQGDLRHFNQECEALKRLCHPNIISLIGFNDKGMYVDEKKKKSSEVCYTLLEYADHGNLLDFVNNKPMNENLVRFYFRQLLDAAGYMH